MTPDEQARSDAAHSAQPRAGVLLINLGTPDTPDASAIRRYLREFLSDRRVVDLPRWLWWPVLNGIILTLRPRRLAHSYGSIWTEQGSPLLSHSRALAERLAARLAQAGDDGVPVLLAMRYGNPSLADAMHIVQEQNIRRLLVLPLYPQYSATTTASAMDGVFAQLQRMRWMPELRSIHSYHDDPGYISALAHSVRAHWEARGRGDHLMMSFHGIPQRYFLAGDPYHCHCQKTARLLAESLALEEGSWSVSFQSRFGREPWLQPYTDARIDTLAARGVRQLDVICPGFSADCLETLEEVAMQYAEQFQIAGGQALRYIPALNDGEDHAAALQALLQPHLADWRFAEVDAQAVTDRAAAISLPHKK